MKQAFRSSLFLFIILCALLSVPKRHVERTQGALISILAPSTKFVLNIKDFIKKYNPLASISFQNINHQDQNLNQLQLENLQLNQTLQHLKELLAQKLNIKNLSLEKYLAQSINAKVIYRSPSTWNSSFWINVGTSDNLEEQSPIIAKNSPVVIGTHIIGVIDYVGKKQSRVRLITDSGLTPSVRAQRVLNQQNTLHLAKGELHGNSYPLWRSKGNLLKGIGFNYDTADEFGPSRDLRTGKASESNSGSQLLIPIIQINDLLVTTGMDGIFPPGFSVAKVITIKPLQEGDYYYEIEAIPTAGNLNDLSFVSVLPPLGFDSTDQPSRIKGLQ